jgi:GntR family transcriptional regulator/MocR family aminotransferase
MDVLTLAIDTDSKTPIYEQLYSFIKSEIQSRRIIYNTKLPSKRKLAVYLNISQNSVQAAYDQLIEEGYVVSKERSGYYVSKIDNIIKLGVREAYSKTENSRSQTEAKYDFSYHGVDMQTFPFSIWRKLTRDVIDEYDSELLKIGDSQGHSSLRGSIAEYLYQSRGVNCLPEQVIISSGTEFLFQILIQLFDRGSIYGIENPGYEKLNLQFSSNGLMFNPVNIDDEGMILEEIIKSKANIICVTPAHQFPSGIVMPINRRIQILNWANGCKDRYIIEDDYDSEFKYSGKPIPALQGLDTNEKVIYMGAFSKSFSPAIRVSYMVLPMHLLEKYYENLSYIICPVPMVIQKVLFKFIQNGCFESHLNKMRNIYKRKRELLVRSIYELNCGIEVSGAEAGLHLLLKVNNGMTEEQLISSALLNGVKVYGISKYYFDKKHIGKSPLILIGYAAMNEREICEAVRLLYETWF